MFLNRVCVQNGVEPKVFTAEALARLESYRWPGNVRELRNVVERVAILCDGSRIELSHLPLEIRQSAPSVSISHLPQDWQAFRRLKQEVRDAAGQELERRFLTEALQRCDGNVTKDARDVGMQRTNFHALMRKYGIGASAERPPHPDAPSAECPD
jgi:DNA-binding NtrC family response regulator